jgi:drug/metabolite transporter (DMT)-like permease
VQLRRRAGDAPLAIARDRYPASGRSADRRVSPTGVGFGLAAAVSWGSADFWGGIASRRTAPLATVVLSQATGLAIAIAILLAVGEPAPAGVAMLWAAVSGVGVFVALICLYRALTTGAMGLVASIAAVVGAGLPVVAGAVTGDRLSLTDAAGIALALAAVVLVTRPSQHAVLSREVVGLALLAGVGAGCFYIAMGQSADAGGGTWWPIVASRSTSLALAVVLLAASGGLRTTARSPSLIMVVIGLADVAGTAFFLLAKGQGALSIAAVVASQHPAATTILARLVLKERLARTQVAGTFAALAAIALIAIP